MSLLSKSWCLGVLLGLSVMTGHNTSAFAQQASINPYPDQNNAQQDDGGAYEAFQPDQAVIMELLARQKERKKRAASSPVDLNGANAAPAVKVYRTREEAPNYQRRAKSLKPFEQFKQQPKTEAKPKKLQPKPITAPEPFQAETFQAKKKVIPITQWHENFDDKDQAQLKQPEWPETKYNQPRRKKLVKPKTAELPKPENKTAEKSVAQSKDAIIAGRNKIVPTREPSVQPEENNVSPAYQEEAQEAVKVARIVDGSNKGEVKTARKETVEALDNAYGDQDMPAYVHEQALKRGLQAQVGQVVPPRSSSVEEAAMNVFSQEAINAIAEEEKLIAEEKQKIETSAPDLNADLPKTEMLTTQVPGLMAMQMQNQAQYGMGQPAPAAQGQAFHETPAIPATFVAPAEPVIPLWTARKGMSARKVLTQWSRNAGVDLIWNSQFLVDLYFDVEVNGTYEDAVEAVLRQYQGLSAGVHGSLFVDDVSGKRTLVIETNRG